MTPTVSISRVAARTKMDDALMEPVTSKLVADLERMSRCAMRGATGGAAHVHRGEGGNVAGLYGRAAADNDRSGHNVDVNTVQEAAASKFEGSGGDGEGQAAATACDVTVAEGEAEGAGHAAEDAA